jgi:hypothetical protein
MKHIIQFFVILTAVSSSLVSADCKEAVMPGLPNPDEARESEMLQAELAVRQYIADQELFLNCVHSHRRHNKAVEKMRVMAEKFNRDAKRYRVRMDSLNSYTELAFVD